MTDSEETPPIETRLRTLIESSGLQLKAIAEEAEVPYTTFQKWVKGTSQSLKLSHGEALWEYFTGQKFQ